jgi:hypothetical protein
MGGDLVTHLIAPLVDVKVSALGASQSKSGLGDMTVGVGLGYHHSPQLHSAVALDLILPTGDYDKNNLANIGRNYASIEPVYVLTYVDPKGFNGDMRIGYLVNRRNKDTNYASGDEWHLDYAAGWGLGNGWTMGVGGYLRQQTGLDEKDGVKLPNSKTSGMAIGPNLKYDSGKGWFVTAKWQFETKVKNGTEGNALWLKAVFPLKIKRPAPNPPAGRNEKGHQSMVHLRQGYSTPSAFCESKRNALSAKNEIQDQDLRPHNIYNLW